MTTRIFAVQFYSKGSFGINHESVKVVATNAIAAIEKAIKDTWRRKTRNYWVHHVESVTLIGEAN